MSKDVDRKKLSTPNNRLLTIFIVSIFAAISAFYLYQGVQSSTRLYKSILGYSVQAFDITPRWIGTRNLLVSGVDPYSTQGQALIEQAYFGRSLQPEDAQKIHDQQAFAYPLYVILIYAPTVVLSFSVALLIFWGITYLLLILAILLLLRILSVNPNRMFTFAVLTVILLMPYSYDVMQTRQPIVFPYVFLVSALYLIVCRKSAQAYFVAGSLLFLSTIKPQNSILVIPFILFLCLPVLGNKKSIKYVWLGFFALGCIALAITLLLVPHWIGEFLQNLSDYRNYAGSTGGEAVFSGLALIIAYIFFSLTGIIMSVASYMTHNRYLFLITFAYLLILQGFLFPAHTYVIITGIPIIILGIFEFSQSFRERRRLVALLIGLLLFVIAYTVYVVWLNMATEMEFIQTSQTFIKILTQFNQWFPQSRGLTFPLLLILGMVVFVVAYLEQRYQPSTLSGQDNALPQARIEMA